MFCTIDYTQSSDQIEQAAKLLENMVTRKNLDLPYDFELRMIDDSLSSTSSLSVAGAEDSNLINLMEAP